MAYKVKIGRMVATQGIMALLDEGLPIRSLITRHASGDWGDLDACDKALNDAAVTDGSRIMSSYVTSWGKVWIVTESRDTPLPLTTVMLPEEY